MNSKIVCARLDRDWGGAIGLVTVLLVVLFSCSTTLASMYVCRDKSGRTSFTNLPGGTNCKPYSIKKNKRSRQWKSGGSNSARYDHYIRRVAKRYNVDPRLIKAIIKTESDFNHRAVSKSGAQGLMQLMPETARDLRVSNPFNPKENIDGGTRYFRKMMDTFKGDLVLSLAAYNAGPGLVMRTGGVPQIAETRRYIDKVLKRYKAYKVSWRAS